MHDLLRKKRRLSVRRLGAAALLLLLAAVGTVDASAQCEPMQQVGGWEYGEATGVAVDGAIVFSAAGRNLIVTDTSVIDGRETLAELDLDVFTERLLLSGTTLAVAGWTEDFEPLLLLLDVSDPGAPVVEARLDMTGIATDLAATGDGRYLMMTDRSRRFVVVDMGDPGQAQVVAAMNLADYPMHLDVDDGLAAVDLGGGVVQFLDISDPVQPVTVVTADLGRPILDLVLRGRQLMAVDAERTLLLYDVADPAAWELVAAHETDETLLRIFERGDDLIVGTNIEGLKALTFDDFGVPAFRMILPGQASIWNQTALGDERIAYSHPLDGVLIYDASDFQAVHLQDRIPMENPVGDVAVTEGIAYLGHQDGGVMALDVSDPGAVRRVGRLGYDTRVRRLEVRGDVLYATMLDLGLVILDVSDPAAISELSRMEFGDGVMWFDVADGIAYVQQLGVGLHIVDVSDPAGPELIRTYPVGGGATAAEGRTVVALNSGLLVYDMTDPMAPSLVGPIGLVGGGSDVDLRDGYAYVAAGQQGVAVVDVRDPAAPVVVTYVETNGPAASVLAEDGYLFTCNSLGRLRVFSTADPAQPVRVGCLDAGSADGPMAAEDDLLLHLPWTNELEIYRTAGVVATEDDDGQAPALLSGRTLTASPNPFNPATLIAFELAVPGRVELTVHDMLGRRVRTLVSDAREAGRHEVLWDGSGARGERAASGVYFLRLATDARVETRKVMLAK